MYDNLIITVISLADPRNRARFTWDEDFENCECDSIGMEADEIDALIAARAHEGATVTGYATDIAYGLFW